MNTPTNILVTGGAGFIGSNFIYFTLGQRPDWHIVNLDALTYAGNLDNLAKLPDGQRKIHTFVRGNICDTNLIKNLFSQYQFEGVIHFAAESHVDRSIAGPQPFIETNVNGTCALLQTSLNFFKEHNDKQDFRFHHHQLR